MAEPSHKRRKQEHSLLTASSITISPPKQHAVGDLFNPTMVTIIVKEPSKYEADGVDQQTPCSETVFSVPRGLICAHSKYFDALFRKLFAESKSLRSQVMNTAPWVLKCFISWLYFRMVYLESTANICDDSPNGRRCTSEDTNAETTDEEDPKDPVTWKYRQLFQLYVFGDKYDCREFRMSVLEIVQIKGWQVRPREYSMPDKEDLLFAIANQPVSSPLMLWLAYLLEFEVACGGLTMEQLVTYLPAPFIAKMWDFSNSDRLSRQSSCKKRCCRRKHGDYKNGSVASDGRPSEFCFCHEHGDNAVEKRLCKLRKDTMAWKFSYEGWTGSDTEEESKDDNDDDDGD